MKANLLNMICQKISYMTPIIVYDSASRYNLSMKLDLEEEQEGLKRSNQEINVVHGLVEIENKNVHRQLNNMVGEAQYRRN